MSDGYFILGYLSRQSGKFWSAFEVAATPRNRTLILRGELIPLREACIPPAISEWRTAANT